MSSVRPALPSSPTRVRLLAVGALTVGLLGAGASAAQAHVTVRADSTTAGSFSQLTFRVPNESDDAGTVKVAVQLPQDKPFRFVSVKPVEGWTVKVEETDLPQPIEAEGATLTKAARTVTWTADKGEQIAPGEYQDFSISAGPLPEAGALTLPAVQTYSDGEVVAWNQPTPASGEEPEQPAPTFEVVAAGAEEAEDHHSAPSTAPTTGAASATAGSSTDTGARGLAGAALAVGVAAGALGGLALRRAGRR